MTFTLFMKKAMHMLLEIYSFISATLWRHTVHLRPSSICLGGDVKASIQRSGEFYEYTYEKAFYNSHSRPRAC